MSEETRRPTLDAELPAILSTRPCGRTAQGVFFLRRLNLPPGAEPLPCRKAPHLDAILFGHKHSKMRCLLNEHPNPLGQILASRILVRLDARVVALTMKPNGGRGDEVCIPLPVIAWSHGVEEPDQVNLIGLVGVQVALVAVTASIDISERLHVSLSGAQFKWLRAFACSTKPNT